MSERKIKKIIALSFLMMLCAVGAAKAQQTTAAAYIVKSDANAGELNSAQLDYLATEQQTTNERIFVIARLGRSETARALNLQRLKAARSYLVETKGINKEQIVFAEGERVAGEGRLEFYLGSKFMLVSLAPRGENVRLVCCVD